jgi:hypothetical protein
MLEALAKSHVACALTASGGTASGGTAVVLDAGGLPITEVKGMAKDVLQSLHILHRCASMQLLVVSAQLLVVSAQLLVVSAQLLVVSAQLF